MSAGQTLSIFPTLVFKHDHPGLETMNQALMVLILDQEKDGKEIKRVSLVGGYRSDREFFDQPHWAVQALKKLVLSNLADYAKTLAIQETGNPDATEDLSDIDLWGWSLVLREGDMVAPHLHKRCNVVGTYYVHTSVEDPLPNAGQLILCDPRVRAYAMPVEDQAVTVTMPHQTSRMVLFPSFLEHYVLPFKGPGERISVAFNIRFQRAAL